ncbi:MAG: 50S ribosomal protein L11 methyltransferase [Syntrophaceae bacterium]|nr:50S ribosomal protein L11 methyltransferase [Syntrophaceae bacterium]
MPEQSSKGEKKHERWLKVSLQSPPELSDALSNFMTELGVQGVYQEAPVTQDENEDFPSLSSEETIYAFLPLDVRSENRIASLTAYLENLTELFPELPAVRVNREIIENPDWGEEWKKYFKPLRVSRSIVVKPTWERYASSGRDIVIDIDPGMAFGTGQHPSTRMCLEAIEDLMLHGRHEMTWHVLDVGTGTGILGITAAKIGAEKVLCVDVDRKAVEIARENVAINQVSERVAVVNRDVSTIRDSFNLIVANLTAKLLLKLRSHLTSLLEDGGWLILSGILEQQRGTIEEHFITDRLTVQRLVTEKEWICFALKKGGGGA